MFRFHQSRLQTQEKLGKGRFGTVFPYQKDPQDHKWAVKRIKAEDSDALVACLPEIVLGFACDHPCVVPVKGYYIEKNSDGEAYNIYMKLPRMKETLLSDFKERKRKNTLYSEQEIIRHFYSLACGIGYLHSKKIYHGDIKPDNLLLDEQGNLKVADVGMAKHVEEEDSYQTLAGSVGTYQYSAPEILGQKTTKETLPKADIWSIGAVILELCVFDFKLLNCILPRDQLQNALNDLFKRIQGKFDPSLVALVQKLLDLDPKERPDIGQIKSELEESFSQILDKELLSLGNVSLIQVDKGEEIKALNQQIREVSGKYEYEVKRLKESIGQLEEQLIQQKQQHEDRIKVLVGQSDSKAREEHSKEQSESLVLQTKIKGLEQELDQLKVECQGHRETNEKVRSLEEQVQTLKRENTSYEQKSKDLQIYLDTSIKEQMKAYEDQIKALKESQLEEKTQFDQEKKKPLEDPNTLQLKLEDGGDAKIEPQRESFGEDYERDLNKAILKLQSKWNRLFEFEGKDRRLKIVRINGNLTDENVSELSKDLIEILGECHLFNLFGLEIDLANCRQLTDKALEYVALALSNQALHLQHLILNFNNIPKISDIGVEKLSVVIKDSCHNLQELRFHLSTTALWLRNKVTEEKKESLRKRFAHIPTLEIK